MKKIAILLTMIFNMTVITYCQDSVTMKVPYGASAGLASTSGIGAGAISSLTDVTLTSLASGDFLKYNGSAWINRTASNVRTDLGLVISTNVQAYDADLTTYAGITPSANVQTLLGSADYSAFKTSLSINNVTNESKATMFTSPTFTGTAALGTSPTMTTPNITTGFTIDGSTTYSLASQYKYVTVQSNGSNWIIIANN